MVKKKRLIAIALIFIGLIGLAIAIAPLLGLMTVTSAAFDDYPTEFDPLNSTAECSNENPEFETTTKDFTTTNGSIFFENQKPRTICGISNETAVYSPYTNTLSFQNFEAGKELIGYPQTTTTFTTTKNITGFVATENGAIGEPCWLESSGTTIGGIKGTITKSYSKEYESQASTIYSEKWCPTDFPFTVDRTGGLNICLCFYSHFHPERKQCIDYCQSHNSTFREGAGAADYCVRTLGEPAQNETITVMECVYPKTITLNPNTPITVKTNQTQRGGISELLLPTGATTTKTITYTVPRSTIPNTLHYREYSCPLESGRYLTAQTFTEHDNINANSFAYEPNYFCSRHGIIKTELATQRSVETTEEYRQIVAGQTVTVPAGDTWTFFYVPKTNVNLPIKCEEGDYYDIETEKCVKLIGGFVYICTDPETNLIGNQCVKEADLKIVCPIDSDLIDGKCYLAGETIITCPTGYTKAGNKCYQQGNTVTTCPEGYELRSGACYIEGKNIIVCPEGYDLQNSQCIKRGNLITTCQSGYELIDGGCYRQGETFIVCPTDYTLQNNKCYKDGIQITTCPTGYTLKDGACYTIGTQNMVCPDGTHKTTIDGEERCIIDSTYCPDGYTRQDDKCVKGGEIICPSGTIKIGDNCQRTETVCPEGTIEINNKCVRNGEIICPEGTQMNEAKQCVQDPIELPDINYLSAGIGTITLLAGAILFRF